MMTEARVAVLRTLPLSNRPPEGGREGGREGEREREDGLGEGKSGFRAVFRNVFTQAIILGMLAATSLIVWKGLICFTGSESPLVVVLSGSMEPGFQRGDLLFLRMSKDPIRAGEIVVYNTNGYDIPIVHRVIEVHERQESGEVDVLTKGDNNLEDDRTLYAHGQFWLHQHRIMGKAVGFLPYAGWGTIILTDYPEIKYIIFGVLALLAITLKE